MKKIIMLAIFSVLLVSCGTNNTNLDINTAIDDMGISNNIETLYLGVDKLKTIDISENDISVLNDMINNIYNKNIIDKALKENDIKICSKLGQYENIDCEEQIIVASENINLCNNLSNTGSINTCKNKIYLNKANNSNDENICEQLIDNSEEKFKINNCKNKIFFDKAIKKIDKGFCDKISDDGEREMCKDIIKMEKKANL